MKPHPATQYKRKYNDIIINEPSLSTSQPIGIIGRRTGQLFVDDHETDYDFLLKDNLPLKPPTIGKEDKYSSNSSSSESNSSQDDSSSEAEESGEDEEDSKEIKQINIEELKKTILPDDDDLFPLKKEETQKKEPIEEDQFKTLPSPSERYFKTKEEIEEDRRKAKQRFEALSSIKKPNKNDISDIDDNHRLVDELNKAKKRSSIYNTEKSKGNNTVDTIQLDDDLSFINKQTSLNSSLTNITVKESKLGKETKARKKRHVNKTIPEEEPEKEQESQEVMMIDSKRPSSKTTQIKVKEEENEEDEEEDLKEKERIVKKEKEMKNIEKLSQEMENKKKEEQFERERKEKKKQDKLEKERNERKRKQEQLANEKEERKKQEKLNKEKEEKLKQEKFAKEKEEKLKREKLAKEKEERIKQDKLAKEKIKQEKLEKEKIMQEKFQKEEEEKLTKEKEKEEKEKQELLLKQAKESENKREINRQIKEKNNVQDIRLLLDQSKENKQPEKVSKKIKNRDLLQDESGKSIIIPSKNISLSKSKIILEDDNDNGNAEINDIGIISSSDLPVERVNEVSHVEKNKKLPEKKFKEDDKKVIKESKPSLKKEVKHEEKERSEKDDDDSHSHSDDKRERKKGIAKNNKSLAKVFKEEPKKQKVKELKDESEEESDYPPKKIKSKKKVVSQSQYEKITYSKLTETQPKVFDVLHPKEERTFGVNGRYSLRVRIPRLNKLLGEKISYIHTEDGDEIRSIYSSRKAIKDLTEQYEIGKPKRRKLRKGLKRIEEKEEEEIEEIELNDSYSEIDEDNSVKLLVIKPMSQKSLSKNYQTELLFRVRESSGRNSIIINDKEYRNLKKSSSVNVPPNCEYQIKNYSKKNFVVAICFLKESDEEDSS